MNKQQKKQIAIWLDSLESIKSGIEEMQSEEEEKYDNLPESLQDSERGEAMCQASENLELAAGSLDDAIASLYEISM